MKQTPQSKNDRNTTFQVIYRLLIRDVADVDVDMIKSIGVDFICGMFNFESYDIRTPCFPTWEWLLCPVHGA